MYNDRSDKYLRRTTFVITQRCTLKCKLCLAFMPYYDNPVHTAYEQACRIIDNYFKIVDQVGIFYKKIIQK